jgi:predicted acyl esterase
MACQTGCKDGLTPLYLQPDFALGFASPQARPAKATATSPIPPSLRPIPPPGQFDNSNAWRTWLVRDQRFVDGRPGILTYKSQPLTAPVRIQGAPTADIVAATTGTDGDFVVKLIDVYPPEWPSQPELGGYELPSDGHLPRPL